MLDFSVKDLNDHDRAILASSVANPVLTLIFRNSKENVQQQLINLFKNDEETAEQFVARHEILRFKAKFYTEILEEFNTLIKQLSENDHG